MADSRRLVIILLLLVIACRPEPGSKDPLDYSKVADKICNCCQSIMQANDKLLESQTSEEFTGQLKELASITESSLFCSSAAIPRKERQQLDFSELRKELDKKCPLPPKLLEDLKYTLDGTF